MRILACNMNALATEQRARHVAVTKRLLAQAARKELADGYAFTIDCARVSVAELAEWVADESRCCPAVDFHVELPAFGPLTPPSGRRRRREGAHRRGARALRGR